AALLAECPKRIDIARTVSPEMEIGTRDDDLRIAAPNENLVDEYPRFGLREFFIETLDDHLVASGLEEELAPSLNSGEEDGGALRSEDLRRVGIEEKTDGSEAALIGTLFGRADERAMAEVDAIMIAGRDG